MSVKKMDQYIFRLSSSKQEQTDEPKSEDDELKATSVERRKICSVYVTDSRIRKYCAIYLEYGFVVNTNESVEQTQCILCYRVLPNECMKPPELIRNFQTNYAQ